MALTYQEVKTTDALRKRVVHLRDIGTLTQAADQDCALVQGLNGSGGTIVAVRARVGANPTGTTSALTYDIHKNGTTIFTSGKIVWGATLTGAATPASIGAFTGAGEKVYNGDRLSLDADNIGNSGAGANAAIAVEIRVDEPND